MSSVSNQTVNFYWRAYGNNYPLLVPCSSSEVDRNRGSYPTGVGAHAYSYRGLYIYDRHGNSKFLYVDLRVPLTYCADTYYYSYGRSTYGKLADKVGMTAEKLFNLMN